MQPRPQNRAPERLSQVFVTIQLFYTGSLPCRCVPRRCFFMRDSPSGSAPNRSASYHRVSMPRVSPHLCGLTDVTAIHEGVSSGTSAPLTFPHYRIGFPLQVRTRRGPTSRLAPPPHRFQVHKPEVRSPPR